MIYLNSDHFFMKLIVAAIILIVGIFISKIVRNLINKILQQYDEIMARFLSSLVNVILIVLVVVIAIAQLGVPISPITGVLTGIVFGVSMSLKSSYSIIASGIMLAFSKPFSIGEKVDIGGSLGVVKSVGFLYTKLESDSGDEIVLSNSIVMSRVVTRYLDSK
ncbi:mechanosensitive ion channel family protein [Francisella frigiditurris]|uniref:Small-conductance mechanosensitive channel n=1 Tax=Francisella frigiditurris TaxID=1542390 RepID=A0A1J0KUP7_9GAMM|nr:mechanosensitive ion channel domain-containing protein [Francisella frigiditurris]APC97536.1 mechanosensitive ion channel family protein [Francisella frigiditurris]